MVKVSHELPINLLHKSFDWNDYEYCLPHLLDWSEEYKNHFLKAKQSGSYIIMDNSLHELGKAYAEDRLLHWIKALEPDEFIVPDVWQNQISTITNAAYWIHQKLPSNVMKVAVVQARSFNEAVSCYTNLKKLGYKKIAFSYGAEWYCDEQFPHPNKFVGKMMGRILTLHKMLGMGIIEKTDKIHLLGCALPQEFSYYNMMMKEGIIESLDTSNPIIHGLKGIKYKHYGLKEKDPTKIDQLEEVEITSDILYNINHNLIKFKQFLK